VSDEIEGADSGASDADRWLIVGFIVCLLLGLGILGAHCRPSTSPAPICADSEARCGDRSEPAQ
jgi:hypothetical protein